MMSDSYSEPQSPPSASCCSTASAELKLYQTFIFSVPIFFTFVLLLLFYLFYLRRRRVDWSSLRMRTSLQINDDISRAELGLKKEVREMLPIIVFKESFSVKDTQCSVCLGEYEAEDKLQQIPACGHTFHMDCIDHWLATRTTCPLCRLSLIPTSKPVSTEPPNIQQAGTTQGHSQSSNHSDETSSQIRPESCESTNGDENRRTPEMCGQGVERSSQCVDSNHISYTSDENETKDEDQDRNGRLPG